MNQLEAMRATLDLARERGYDDISFEEEGVNYIHLVSMYDRVNAAIIEGKPFSEARLGRWLGYIQGVLVANQCCTLEEMKQLNKAFADDNRFMHLKRGTTYEVIGQARLNTTALVVAEWRGPVDGDMLTLYRGEDGVYSVRHPDEFNDGRFVKL